MEPILWRFGYKDPILLSVKNLMKNLRCSSEKTMEMLGIPNSNYEKYMQCRLVKEL